MTQEPWGDVPPAQPSFPDPPPEAQGPPPAPFALPDQTPYGGPPIYGPPVQPYDPSQQYGTAQPYGTAQSPYIAPTGFVHPPTPTSAIILTVVSAVETLSLIIVGLPSLIIGSVALSKNASDPDGSARLAKTGWIVFAVLNALLLIGFIALVIWLATLGSSL